MSFTRWPSDGLQGKAVAMSQQESPYALHKEQYLWEHVIVTDPGPHILPSTLLIHGLSGIIGIIAHRSLTWEDLE